MESLQGVGIIGAAHRVTCPHIYGAWTWAWTWTSHYYPWTWVSSFYPWTCLSSYYPGTCLSSYCPHRGCSLYYWDLDWCDLSAISKKGGLRSLVEDDKPAEVRYDKWCAHNSENGHVASNCCKIVFPKGAAIRRQTAGSTAAGSSRLQPPISKQHTANQFPAGNQQQTTSTVGKCPVSNKHQAASKEQCTAKQAAKGQTAGNEQRAIDIIELRRLSLGLHFGWLRTGHLVLSGADALGCVASSNSVPLRAHCSGMRFTFRPPVPTGPAYDTCPGGGE